MENEQKLSPSAVCEQNQLESSQKFQLNQRLAMKNSTREQYFFGFFRIECFKGDVKHAKTSSHFNEQTQHFSRRQSRFLSVGGLDSRCCTGAGSRRSSC
jgi:hypothetical protein